MSRIRYTAAPKSNLLKVLISIVSLSASITAPSPFNSDSGASIMVPENRTRNRV